MRFYRGLEHISLDGFSRLLMLASAAGSARSPGLMRLKLAVIVADGRQNPQVARIRFLPVKSQNRKSR